MGRNLFLAVLALGWALHAFAAAPSEDWLPLTPQDLQFKQVPGDPNARAVLLYYADYITYVSYRDQTEFIYRRIKILSNAGVEYANVEIPVLPWVKIQDLEARSIHPDGSITDFTARPYDTIILKGRGFKVLAKAFTFPGVAPGTIIEYKYRLHSSWVDSNQWLLEHGLFVLDERFSFKHPGIAMSYVVNGSDARPVQNKESYDLELTNVPAFHHEEQMAPEENYRASVRFFSPGPGSWSGQSFWFLQAREWSLSINNFIGDYRDVARAATAALGDTTDPTEKLRRLYSRAQQIRNLTYERELTSAEEKKEKIRENHSVAAVLKHGYGTAFDVNALFVAMARASGFDARFVLVASRASRFFQLDYLSGDQYDDSIAAVTRNGKTMFFDPGTRFCPFGLIRWTHSSTAGLEIGKQGWFYTTLPSTGPDNAEAFRNMRGALSKDGTLKGEVTLTFTGVEAMERRLLAVRTDEAGRDKMIKTELMEWLPPQSTATVTGSNGWNQSDGALVVTFAVEVPAYASVAGKRLLLPANLFPTNQQATFQSRKRKYPIYFSYAFSEFDLTVLKLPKGYSVENLPSPVAKQAPFGHYKTTLKSADNQVIATRGLTLNQFLFPPEKYTELKQFFSTVENADTAQVVLQRPEATSQAPGAAQH
ncbi:MAG: DUF3857 domain-containing protein [Actinomycetota bacterium]